MKRNLLQKAAGLLLSAMLLLGIGAPAVQGLAAPETPNDATEALTIYAEENYSYLAGQMISEYAHRWDDDKPYVYTMSFDGIDVRGTFLGYRVADFDQDGQDELLQVHVEADYRISLWMYEYNKSSKTVTLTDTYTMADTEAKAFSLIHRLLTLLQGPFPRNIIDVFYYTADGTLYIAVESECRETIPVDHREVNIQTLTYKNNKFSAGGGFQYGGQSAEDIEDDFTKALAKIGIKDANWMKVYDQKAMIGDFIPTYRSVCRATEHPKRLTYEGEGYMTNGNLKEDWSYTIFSMPWQRKPVTEKYNELSALFGGVQLADGDYLGDMGALMLGTWGDDDILAVIYNILCLDLKEDEQWNGLLLPKFSLKDMGISYSKNGSGNEYRVKRSDVIKLLESISGNKANGFVSANDWSIGDDFYAKGDYCYFTPKDFPNRELVLDTVYEENHHVLATGTILNTDDGKNGPYCRFTAGLVSNNDSVFGFSISWLQISGPVITEQNLDAAASSSLPPEDGLKYGPDLVLDGRTDTAWNEGADGSGVGEWVELTTKDLETIPVYGLRILSGYHKSEEVYHANGKPAKIRLIFSDGTQLDRTVQYDDTILWGSVKDITSVHVEVLLVNTGNAYEDTCITEIELLVTEPLNGGALDSVQGGFSSEYYVLPESNKRLYSIAELSTLSKEALRIARNEIYARHGRRFSSKDLQEYFDGMPWYKGTIEPADFDNNVLSSIELENVKRIESLE